MEAVAIATVVAVTGKAYARNADGELREIRPGDVLLEGETVVTPDGGSVELSLSDGSPLVVTDVPEMTLTPDLVADTAAGADESAVQDETIDVTLTFENAGEIMVTIPIDNARMPKKGHGHGDHSGHDHSGHDHSGNDS